MAKAKLFSKYQYLIQIFDKNSFTENICWGHNCKKTATRFTVYVGNINPYWWCSTCDPNQVGAEFGKLQSPIKYLAAIRYVEMFCRDNKSDYVEIIKMMAQAKGLPSRVGEKQAQKFFHDY